MAKELFTAIIVNNLPGMSQPQFIKYRNVPKDKLQGLCKYTSKTFPGVSHINLYEKSTKRFVVQLKRENIMYGILGHI